MVFDGIRARIARVSPPTFSPGTRLGPYEIVAPIGQGGMGAVYRARDTSLNRDVAVKVLLPAVADDPDRLARFSREAQRSRPRPASSPAPARLPTPGSG